MSNLEDIKSLQERIKKSKSLQSANLVTASSTGLTSSGETVSDYTIGSKIPYTAFYRFTNVGRTTDFDKNWATNLLTLNKSLTTLELRPRGFIQGSSYEPITQIFKYGRAHGSARALFSEYIEENPDNYVDNDLPLVTDEWTINSSPKMGKNVGSVNISVASTASSNTGFSVKVYIRAKQKGPYLTADATGTGLKWTSTPMGDRSLWYAERVYKVRSIPGFKNGVEFFSAQTMYQMPDVQRWTSYDEMADGPIDDSWQGGADFLFARCFGMDVLDAQLAAGNYSKIYGNMYGALYSGSVYAGKFHTGVDINYFHHAIVKSPVDGTIVQYMKADDSLNTVIILGTDGFYYNLLHMDPLDEGKLKKDAKVVAGVTPVGKQSNAGLNASGSQDSHLHVEVKALNTGATDIPVSSFDYIGNYYPYDIYYSFF